MNNNSLPVGFDKLRTEKPYINLGKLAEGEHRFRIVARPIAGWVDWKDKKPMRFRPEDKPKSAVDPTKPIKPFWAIHVWDYAKEGLYIMEITQNSIRRALEMLAMNEDWGDLTSFDFKIKKEGAGIDTNYSVIPIPPKPMLSVIKEALIAAPVRLEALYEGLDPWTDLVAASGEIASFRGLTEGQTAQLDTLLQKINDKAFQKELETHLQVASIYNIPEQEFERALRALETRVNSKKQEKKNESRSMASVA
jgi:hypothetical protein